MKLQAYFRKMRGIRRAKQPPLRWHEIAWAGLGALLGMGALTLAARWVFDPLDLPFLIGSFGASAVLIYGVMRSPLAQPRNLLGGHILSALVGVTCWKLLGQDVYLAATISVAAATMLMQVTHTLHPPGGATALLAIVGSEKIHAMGYWYVLLPATLGPLLLLFVALLVNNVSAARQYPDHWF